MSHPHEADIHHRISTQCWLRFKGAKIVAGSHSGPTDGGGMGPSSKPVFEPTPLLLTSCKSHMEVLKQKHEEGLNYNTEQKSR
jgi:hypothetical protein